MRIHNNYNIEAKEIIWTLRVLDSRLWKCVVDVRNAKRTLCEHISHISALVYLTHGEVIQYHQYVDAANKVVH